MTSTSETRNFGRWTVIEDLGWKPSGRRLLCRCECGTEKAVLSLNLKRGMSLSCGCLRVTRTAATKTTHGDCRSRSRSPEYAAYRDMLARCTYANRPAFKDYGARGIEVCARWRHGENGVGGYMCFLADMGRKPSPDLSLDRRDNDGNYEPDNCRWATRTEQNNNTRRNRARASKQVTVVA